MKVKFVKKPFPHVLISKLFTKKQYKEVFTEILELVPRLLPPSGTKASITHITEDIVRVNKKGFGIFVDDIFGLERDNSAILSNLNNLFSEQIFEIIKKDDCLFKYYYELTKKDFTLLQSYGDGDFYLKHTDEALFTAITLIHSEPKKYTGGDLFFPDHDYIVPIENNGTIIFPSVIPHEVTTVTKKEKDANTDRYTLTKFMHY